MGLISSVLKKPILNYSMADFDKDVHFWLGDSVAHSGVQVNEHSGLRHITVDSCMRVRGESFASLPLSIYKKRSSGKGQDEAWDHPLYVKIHAVPNPDMTSLTWRERQNLHLDLSGNCYSIITLNRRGSSTPDGLKLQ